MNHSIILFTRLCFFSGGGTSMSLLTEYDDMSVIGTTEDDNETVIKHYQWSKASGQLQATVNGTCIHKQNTKEISHVNLFWDTLRKACGCWVPRLESLFFRSLSGVSTFSWFIRAKAMEPFWNATHIQSQDPTRIILKLMCSKSCKAVCHKNNLHLIDVQIKSVSLAITCLGSF